MREFVKASAIFSVLLVLFLALGIDPAVAGTGGSEISSWWTDISNGLKGFWGKLLAAILIGFAFMAGKSGNVMFAVALFILGLSVGTIPDIVDAKYTLTVLG